MKKKLSARRALLASLALVLSLTSPVFANSLTITSSEAYLSDYSGDALDFTGKSTLQYIVYFSGANRIETSGEFGVLAATDELHFSPLDPSATLDIIVHSPSSTARGIYNSAGMVIFNRDAHVTISLTSAATAADTGDAVAGVVAARSITTFPGSTLSVTNPTGTYGLYASAYSLFGNLGAPSFSALYKTADDLSAAVYNSENLVYSTPDFTPSLTETETSGSFRLSTALASGVATTFDTAPVNLSNLSAEQDRLRASLATPADATLYAVDPASSEIIENSGHYFFRVVFRITSDFYAFSDTTQGPYSFLYLNGEECYPEDFNRQRSLDGQTESFDLPLATYRPDTASVIVVPIQTVEDETPEITIVELPVPKAPNTGLISH